MATAKDIIRYLRECYRENGSRGGLWNIFADSISHRIFLNGNDFPASRPQADDSHYLRETAAESAARQAELYRKEKELIHASVFLLGWAERAGSQPEPICAPLILHPATLDTGGLKQGATLRIDPTRRTFNTVLLEAVGGDDFARHLETSIDPELSTEAGVGEIRRAFAAAFPDSQTDPLLGYPDLLDGSELRKRFEAISKSLGAPFLLIPAACVALVNKSIEMRGVLNELDAMATPGTSLSPPVRALLGEPPGPVASATIGRVPATLSEAQDRVLRSARDHALTLAIGPPGTGKSFTIAALAIETLSRGGSVLIASKMDHAVDVVGKKIEDSIGLEGVVIRGGRSEYLKQLKQFIDDLLAGLHTATSPDAASPTRARRDLQTLEKRIARLSRRLGKRLQCEQSWGDLLCEPAPGFFRRLARRRLISRLENPRERPVWELAAEIEGLIDSRHAATISYLRLSRFLHLARVLRTDRALLQDFSRAIRARTGTRQASYFDKIGVRRLLGALPVWLVNLSDIHRVLPLESEAFDLAIIDEATQCDIASALPILQRARRAVITGDPKQLRHLSFLPRARQEALATQCGLDADQLEKWNFRDVSLLDLAAERIADQGQVAFLNEHFRSRPEIIAFSNREFYGGRLHIMTGHHPTDSSLGFPLQFHRVAGGSRGENGANPAEADAVIDAIGLIERAEASLPSSGVHSIGVLSPFRDQVDHLLARIARHPRAEAILSRHDLLVGTAHTFQGEERDIMFVSLALDDHSPAASYRFLEKADVFNVSITRARLLNRVFHSFDPGRLDPQSMLARYIGSATALSDQTETGRSAKDSFAAEVAAALTAAGAEVRPHFPLAGLEVDLVFTLGGVARGIDLIGFPGATAASFPLERVLTFRRAGLPILPLPCSAWLCQRQRCLDWLASLAR